MIKVSNLQRGNKLLDFLNKTTWHYDASISGDYEIDFTIKILFLSLKFHASKPEYIYKRIKKLKNAKLQVLLILIDTPNYNSVLEDLFATIPIKIILTKNYEECARYLKGFELASKRSSDVLRRKESSVNNFLEAFPKINKTNSVLIQNSFKDIQELFSTEAKTLSKMFGMGKEKAESFWYYLKKPFK